METERGVSSWRIYRNYGMPLANSSVVSESPFMVVRSPS